MDGGQNFETIVENGEVPPYYIGKRNPELLKYMDIVEEKLAANQVIAPLLFDKPGLVTHLHMNPGRVKTRVIC